MYQGPPQGPHGYGAPPPQQGYYQPPPYQQPMVVVQQNTVVMKAPFKHGIHIVLDVVTCGGWLIVHLICWALH